MMIKRIGYFTGYSSSGIQEALENALEKAGEHLHFEVVETSCCHGEERDRQYQVTLSTFAE